MRESKELYKRIVSIKELKKAILSLKKDSEEKLHDIILNHISRIKINSLQI